MREEGKEKDFNQGWWLGQGQPQTKPRIITGSNIRHVNFKIKEQTTRSRLPVAKQFSRVKGCVIT